MSSILYFENSVSYFVQKPKNVNSNAFFWRNDTHNLYHLAVFTPNQFVPELVRHLPCSPGFVLHIALFIFYKLSIPYTGFLDKCHIWFLNTLISLSIILRLNRLLNTLDNVFGPWGSGQLKHQFLTLFTSSFPYGDIGVLKLLWVEKYFLLCSQILLSTVRLISAGWLVVLGFNATLTAKVISWR